MYCVVCGNEIPLKDIISFSFVKLNHNAVCKECKKSLPTVLDYKNSTDDFIKEVVKYEQESSKIFECTSHFGSLYLDEMNGKIAYSKNGRKEPKEKCNIFDVKDIENITLTMTDPVVDKKKIFCDILLNVHLKSPSIHFCKPIKKRAECEYKRISDTKVKCSEPKELTIARNLFMQMVENNVSRLQKLLYIQNEIQEQAKTCSLRQAEALFMLDKGYTLEDVKRSRNILIKAFHPDVSGLDGSYAEKINNAFEVLRKECKD